MPSLRFAEDLQQLVNLLPKPCKIIDCQTGQGQYTQAFQALGHEVLAFDHATRIDDTLIPHRTIHAIWMADASQDAEPALFAQRLSQCASWLVPGGYIALVLRSGEGSKRVNGQTVYQYQGPQADALLQSTGFKPLHAWLDGPLERQSIHIIAQVV